MDEARNWLGREGFTRPTSGRWIGGVCAGIALKYGVATMLVRVLFVLSCFLPGPQFLVYIALWLLMPEERRMTETF